MLEPIEQTQLIIAMITGIFGSIVGGITVYMNFKRKLEFTPLKIGIFSDEMGSTER